LEQQTDNVAPPRQEPATTIAVDTNEQPKSYEEVNANCPGTGILIIRATRSWIQYGTVGFAVMCIIIGALEGLFGR